MDKGTRPKGWHDDFASDRPEHARRQVTGGNPDCPHCTGDGCPIEHCPNWDNFASPTGPDTRQADMVSREKVLALLDGGKSGALEAIEECPEKYTAEVVKAVTIPLFDKLIELVRKL